MAANKRTSPSSAPEYRRVHSREYRQANPEKCREQQRKSYVANRQRRLEYMRKKYAENPGKYRETNRINYLANREKRIEYTRQWRLSNPEACRMQGYKSRGLPEPTRPMPELCECCGGPSNGQGSLHLDHCHKTGKFRGWLCHSCNVGIGHLGDTITTLRRATEYLIRTSAEFEEA